MYPGRVIDAIPILQSVGKQQHSSISIANNTPRRFMAGHNDADVQS